MGYLVVISVGLFLAVNVFRLKQGTSVHRGRQFEIVVCIIIADPVNVFLSYKLFLTHEDVRKIGTKK